MSFNDSAIVSVKENDCRSHFKFMSKDEAINIMKYSDLKVQKYTHYMIFVYV